LVVDVFSSFNDAYMDRNITTSYMPRAE